MVHLAYCDNVGKKGEKVLDKILDGRKTMTVRGAAGRKIPHSRVFAGEKIYFMEKGSLKISACTTVKSVQNYVKLTDSEISEVFDKNCSKLCLTEKQKERWHKKCLCLVEYENVSPIEPALDFDKQSNMDDWIILEKIEDAVVGTSKPFDYSKSKL